MAEPALLLADTKGSVQTLGPSLAGEGTAVASLLIPGEWVTIVPVELHARTTRERLRALPFAMEDKLAEPIENVHSALLSDTLAIAVSRERLELVVDHAAQQGWRVTVIQPDFLSVPLIDGGPAAVQEGERLLVRLEENQGFSCELPLAEQIMARLAHKPRLHREPAERLLMRGFAQERCNLQLPSRLTSDPGAERRWLTAAALAGAALLVGSLGSYFELRSLEQQSARIQTDIEAAFRRALPDARMVDPLAQLRTAASGREGGTSNFFRLLEALDEPATNEGLRIERYEFGPRSSVSIHASDLEGIEGLRAALSERGFTSSVQSAVTTADGVRARLVIET